MESHEHYGVLPPSEEDYRAMWEARSKQLRENEYKRVSEKNMREARKKVFKEAVQEAVRVREERLVGIFQSSIDLQD